MAYGLDVITAWAKRKGFVYPNSDIYGGLANARDYGPYGSQLKKNIADAWWKFFVTSRDDMVGMDTAIIAHPQTWVASGHVGNFKDPLIDDKKTGQRFRADKIIEDRIEKSRNVILFGKSGNSELNKSDIFQELNEKVEKELGLPTSENLAQRSVRRDELLIDFINFNIREDLSQNGLDSINNLIPESWGNERMYHFINRFIPNNPDKPKEKADWTEVRNFNLMLQTQLGVTQDSSSQAYLRPETCQSLFTNFKNLTNTTRVRVPFGMAQIGKAFRNEITPGQFLYRTREFEQMEIEYFVENDPAIASQAHDMWKQLSMDFWQNIIQLKPENLKFREHEHDELSHYSKGTFDVEYNYPWGWGELQGIANRGDWDLTQHMKSSNIDMQYTNPKTGKRYIPWVIEPSFGLSRTVMAVMMDCYDEERTEKEDGTVDIRVVARFPFEIAPVKFAVMPLIEKDERMVEFAKNLVKELKMAGYSVEYDGSGGIGKRYRRQDEIGTPYCICVDHSSVDPENPDYQTVTIRNRDTMEQVRVHVTQVFGFK